jgi:hypothetical protein
MYLAKMAPRSNPNPPVTVRCCEIRSNSQGNDIRTDKTIW